MAVISWAIWPGPWAIPDCLTFASPNDHIWQAALSPWLKFPSTYFQHNLSSVNYIFSLLNTFKFCHCLLPTIKIYPLVTWALETLATSFPWMILKTVSRPSLIEVKSNLLIRVLRHARLGKEPWLSSWTQALYAESPWFNPWYLCQRPWKITAY